MRKSRRETGSGRLGWTRLRPVLARSLAPPSTAINRLAFHSQPTLSLPESGLFSLEERKGQRTLTPGKSWPTK